MVENIGTRSNPNAAQIRLSPASPAKTAGQRKHDLRIGRQPDYVDAKRSHLNRILIQPQTSDAMRRRAIERRDRMHPERAMKSNASVSISGIITFGHLAHLRFERLTPDQQDAAFLELAQAVANRHKAGLTGLVVHVDEAGIHAHFQIDAYTDYGDALSNAINRADLRAVQDLTAEIMGRHCPGIERGRGKIERLKAGATPAEVVYQKPAEMRRHLAADIEQAQTARTDLEAERSKLAARVAKLEAYGSELTEKGAKQLETAQRRLEAKETAIREASETLDRLLGRAREAQKAAQEAQEAARTAQEAQRATEARMAPLRAAVAVLDAHEAKEAQRWASESEASTLDSLKDLFRAEPKLRPGERPSPPGPAQFYAGPIAAIMFLEPDRTAAERKQIGVQPDADPLEIKDAYLRLDRFAASNLGDKIQQAMEGQFHTFIGLRETVERATSWSDFSTRARELLQRLADGLRSRFFKPSPTPTAARPAEELSREEQATIRRLGPGPGL